MKINQTVLGRALKVFAFINVSLLPLGLVANPVEISDIAEVERAANELGDEVGRDKVLVAFDIDDTLLQNVGDLGSQSWFSWQAELIQKGESKGRVADSFAGLLEVDQLVKSFARMKLVQDDSPEIMQRIQSRGHLTMAITSRGSMSVVPAARELLKSRITFANKQAGLLKRFQGEPFLPYKSYETQNLNGLTEEQTQKFKLKKEPTPIAWTMGILATAGQHKGAILRIVLGSEISKIRGIVYVDDVPKYGMQLEEAFQGTAIKVRSLHYRRLEAKALAFKSSDKSELIQRQNRLLQLVERPNPWEFGLIK